MESKAVSSPVLHGDEKKDDGNQAKPVGNMGQVGVPQGISDAEMQKAMEKSMKETIVGEAIAYYPAIKEVTLQSAAEALIIELSYDLPEKSELPKVQTALKKDQMLAEINFQSPILARVDDKAIAGDQTFVDAVSLVANEGLSAQLGKEAQVFFVKKIVFKLLVPVRWKMTQLPGFIRIEFRPYKAGEQEEKKPEQDIVFEAPPLLSTEQNLGESYTSDRQYEREVANGGETTPLEDLNANISKPPPVRPTDYHQAISEDMAREDMRYRNPTFGSLDYWKKHISGVITNVTEFSKRQRNKSFFAFDVPGIAVVYDRPGPMHVRLGYNLQREFPFFYGKLHRETRLSPMDGFGRQDIQAGVVFQPKRRWTYSIQNQLSLGTSENLSAAPKFGDRLTSYNYEAGQALRYKLNRGYLQLGTGLRYQTEETGVNLDAKAYWTAIWFRQLTTRIASRMEYSYTYNFLHDPKPIVDLHVNKMRFGLEYKPTAGITFTPSLGWAFYDAQPFAGFVGGVTYQHKLSPRDLLKINYATDFTRSSTQNFASQSLSNSRTTFSATGDLIRYQSVQLYYAHQLSKKAELYFEGGYRNESEPRQRHEDKFNEYRLSAGIKRQIARRWALELKYALSYLAAYKVGLNNSGDLVRKTDAGNTTQELYLRLISYFGETA